LKVRLSAVTVLLSLVVSQTQAQHGVKFRGSDGWGLAGRYEQYFNKYSQQTFSGKIAAIDTLAPFREMSYGVQMIIKKIIKYTQFIWGLDGISFTRIWV